MKTGFAIYIQDSITPQEHNEALVYARKFLLATLNDEKQRYFGESGGGYTTGLWRGRLGLRVTDDMVFRRISKNQRKFAIVKLDTMVVYNDKYLDKHHKSYRDLFPDGPIPKGCCCPRHSGSIRVKWKNRVPAMSLYAQIGDIKG